MTGHHIIQAAAVAIALAALAGAASAGDLPPDLAKALKDYDRAHWEFDIPRLTQLTSEGYMVLNSNISLENKAQFLADYKLPGFKIDPYVRVEEANTAWKDAAVTAGIVHLSWTQDGKHNVRWLRYVDVWRKRQGRWQATYTQVTLAEPEHAQSKRAAR